MAGRIITFQIMLKDKAGILSEILTILPTAAQIY